MVLDFRFPSTLAIFRCHLPLGSRAELEWSVRTEADCSPRAHFVYNVILLLFGIPTALFTVLLVLRLQFFPKLNLFLVFLPLWIMDCRSEVRAL